MSPEPRRPDPRAAAALAVVVLLAVAALRWEGRRWWCGYGDFSPWSGEVQSRHNSQHLLDAYSLSHVLHGLIFYAMLAPLAPRLRASWRLVIATAIEAGWEILENSEFVVRRYREATAALGYRGDSVINSLGDILACVLGFALARRIGFRASVALFLVVEVGMLFWIRDNLTLNVVMLVWPIEAIKAWQTGP